MRITAVTVNAGLLRPDSAAKCSTYSMANAPARPAALSAYPIRPGTPDSTRCQRYRPLSANRPPRRAELTTSRTAQARPASPASRYRWEGVITSVIEAIYRDGFGLLRDALVAARDAAP